MSDLIDRQAAIKKAHKLCDGCYLSEHCGKCSPRCFVRKIVKILKGVPSAQPGCEDAVSRFEVLRLIDYSSHDLNDSVDNRYMQNEIKQLPSVTPKQPGWIPCSTALPDDDTEVIVSCTDDSGDSEISYVTTGLYYKGLWIVNNDICYFVKAWQPLPATPYWEGGQDEL